MAAVRDPSDPSIKPLSIAGVQHGIVLRMVLAHVDQLFYGRVKGQPLRDAQGQLAFFFHLLDR